MQPETASSQDLAATIRDRATPLPPLDDPGFGRAFDRWADRRIILLGEASHGTSEFYRARAAITAHLIRNHGVSIVALEADWPDAAAVNRLVRGRPIDRGEPPFQRFPQWMWRNAEFFAFVDWLRGWNLGHPEMQAGLYGLDMYSLYGSIRAVLDYLDQIDPEAAALARERYACLEPWTRAAVPAAADARLRACEEAVIRQCRELLERRMRYEPRDPDAFLDAAQNARLITAAERYYRLMHHGGASSWNLRDRHMFETLCHLMERDGAKAVVWAHNSHIGDARETTMGTKLGELNLGQLCREKWGDAVALLGFGTHGGTVAAASAWDAEMEVKALRPARPGSFEAACHDAGQSSFLLELGDAAPELAGAAPLLQRFIGVIYRPESELMSHYLETRPARQYDGWVWFDETSAVDAAPARGAKDGIPETWPWGL